ncbi:MAG: AI-2E family transporter [Proteobacteria bacterium]|nr:MAG: AI-2E family transporter [Pseudomonadota bacterium]
MDDAQFVRRVLLGVGVALALVAACALLVRHPEIPLVLFAGVFAAVLLDAFSRPLQWIGLPRTAAVLAIALLGLAAFAAGAWLLGPSLVQQGSDLADRIPAAIDRATNLVAGAPVGDEVASAVKDGSLWDRAAPFVFGSLAGVFSTALGAATAAIAIAALAIFIALQPRLYLRGLLLLFPEARRARIAEVLGAVAHALRRWMVGRAVSMAVVALLSFSGLSLLGVPIALALAAIAGLLTFVPYVGPVLAAIPALLVALAASPELAIWVLGLYVGVQLIEDYVVAPLAQGSALSLPPALLVIGQIAFGVLLGGLGLLLATPLLVAVTVLVQSLYVEDVLGADVQVLGEPAPEDEEEPPPAPRGQPLRDGRL